MPHPRRSFSSRFCVRVQPARRRSKCKFVHRLHSFFFAPSLLVGQVQTAFHSINFGVYIFERMLSTHDECVLKVSLPNFVKTTVSEDAFRSQKVELTFRPRLISNALLLFYDVQIIRFANARIRSTIEHRSPKGDCFAYPLCASPL